MGEAWVTLSGFFPVVEPGKRANRFMFIERARVIADLERKSDDGTKAARRRWDEARKKRNAEPTGSPSAYPNGSGIPEPMQDQSTADQSRADGLPNGSGIGQPQTGKRMEVKETFNASEIGFAVCREQGWSGNQAMAFVEALKQNAEANPEADLNELAVAMVRGYEEHKAKAGAYAKSPLNYFQSGMWKNAEPKREIQETASQKRRKQLMKQPDPEWQKEQRQLAAMGEV